MPSSPSIGQKRERARYTPLPCDLETNGRVRVVHLITSLDVGGAERMLAKLLETMPRDEFDSHVVTLCDEGALAPCVRRLGLGVTALGLRRGEFNPIALRRLGSILAEREPDLIQAWMYHSNVAASLARPWLSDQTGIVWNIRQSLYCINKERYLTQAVIRSGSLMAPHADALVNNSHVSRQQHETYGYANRRSVVIPNGFDLERFQPDSRARAEFRSELGLGEAAIVVGIVARVHPDKDHALFFRAAEKALARDARLHFVCVGRDTDSYEECTRASQGALRGRLHLLGLRDDIGRVMAGFDMLVSSSATEGCPNCIGEGMASGLAVIGTDVGDTAAVIGPAGRVVARGDDDQLADAIRALAAVSPTERRLLGDSARERIRRHFSIESVAADYAQLYRDVRDQRQGRRNTRRDVSSHRATSTTANS